jgi:hypothetical protein
MEALHRWANCADSHWQDRRYAKSVRVDFAPLLDTSSPTDSGTDCPGNRCAQESVTQIAVVDSARLWGCEQKFQKLWATDGTSVGACSLQMSEFVI